MKANGLPGRPRKDRPVTTTHAPSGSFSLCGAYFAPSSLEDDASFPVVTCKRCLRSMARLVELASKQQDEAKG